MAAPLTRPAHSSLGILYRPMRLEDIDAVHAIDQQSFSLPWPRRSYLFEVTENPAARPWVAELEPPAPPTIVGMVVTWLILDEAHIATIAVHPDHRGRGIGRRLLAVVLSDCYASGARSATLEVRVSNQVAQQLYIRFGFEEVGRRAHYYHDNNEDAVIMTHSGMDQQYMIWLEKEMDS